MPQDSQKKFLIPLMVGITLGSLIIWLVFNLVNFSNKVSDYYNPIIQSTENIYESAIHLKMSLRENDNDDANNSTALFHFQSALLHLKKIVDSGLIDDHREDDLELVQKGNTIIRLIKENKSPLVATLIEEALSAAKKHHVTHLQEFTHSKNRIKQFSYLVAGLSGMVILFGIVSTYREYRFYEASKRELEIVSAITALINALEARDPYTRGHSARVARYSEEIANQLGLNCQEKMSLNLAALMHDIGKIGVPDAVLLKDGPLTDNEFDLIKAHPESGTRILNASSGMNRIIPGILHHHERYDGRGYPARLMGDNIPLIAQVIAVADAYDAMISSRPYRKAMSTEVALSIIKKGRGSQWSPVVVDAFLNVIGEKKITASELENASSLPKLVRA